MSGFDISVLDVNSNSEKGVDVPIVNPRSGEATGLVITVKGSFSSRFQELLKKQKQRNALREKNAVAKAVASDTDDTAEVMAEVTMGWYTVTKTTAADGVVTSDRKDVLIENGKSFPFTKNEAVRVYEAYPVIRAQVLSAALDVANFITG